MSVWKARLDNDTFFYFFILTIFDVLMILYCISLIFRLIGVKSNIPNDDYVSNDNWAKKAEKLKSRKVEKI